MEKGENYNELARTVTINFLNYTNFPTASFHSMYQLYNTHAQHRLNRDLEIHFIEMPKWHCHNLKEMKRLDRWIAYFTNKFSNNEMEAIAMQEPAIQKAIEIESLFTQDDILRREYEQREKAIMDYTSAMDAAQRIGIEYDIKQGIEQGIQRGIEQGLSEVSKKGKKKQHIAQLLNY